MESSRACLDRDGMCFCIYCVSCQWMYMCDRLHVHLQDKSAISHPHEALDWTRTIGQETTFPTEMTGQQSSAA